MVEAVSESSLIQVGSLYILDGVRHAKRGWTCHGGERFRIVLRKPNDKLRLYLIMSKCEATAVHIVQLSKDSVELQSLHFAVRIWG